MNIQRILNFSKQINQLRVVYSYPICNLIHTKTDTSISRNVSTVEGRLLVKDETIFNKLISKVPFLNVYKSRLDLVGYYLYESIADGVDYLKFFKEFSLPDTFYSWFVITELYIWMLMVRCMAEGKDGRAVRNRMVSALWVDVRHRMKKVSSDNPSGTKYQISELSEQFQAALLAYDEGLQTDDTILAGALWRRMYQQKEVDPENLDKLVKYVRKQVRILENLSKNELFGSKPIKWELTGVK